MSVNLIKGISPLISAVMLIAFTITIGSLTAPYLSGLFEDRASDTSDEQEKILETTESDLTLRTIRYNSDSRNYTVEIINSGQTDITNISITFYGDSPTNKRLITTLNPGSSVKTEVNTGSKMERIRVDAENRELTVEEDLD